MNRRHFLTSSGALMALAALDPFTKLAFAHEAETSDDILVYVFLRGGMDGLNLLAPATDPAYINARGPELRLHESGVQKALLMGEDFGKMPFFLHPNASGIKELYDQKNLAIVHATGLTNGTRSHFDAQEIIEKGLLKDKGSRKDGWLARWLLSQSQNTDAAKGFAAFAADPALPLSLLGYEQALALTNLDQFSVNGDTNLTRVLGQLYTQDTALGQAARQTLASVDFIQKKRTARQSRAAQSSLSHEALSHYAPEAARSELGRSLQTVADVIRLDMGLKVATVDMGGWDTHFAQSYRFGELTKALSGSLSAFYNSISKYHKRLTIVVMSEFGRRFKANKSHGTDHGYGNLMMVISPSIKGGRIHGSWPGLTIEQLNHGVDLEITTDYRQVLTDILTNRMKVKETQSIFPDFLADKSLNLYM